jgi:hypothetical protein
MNETPRPDPDRDERLSSIYSATAPEAPPPSLDDAIRAAARRSVAARPQRAGASFARNWQMPLSLAAVLVLCVSLVVVMRDEGSELTQVPRADAPVPAARVNETVDGASAVPKIELTPADVSRSKNIGLKPPPANAPAGSGTDQYALATPAPKVGIRGSVGGLTQETSRGAEYVAPESQPRRAVASPFPERGERAAAEPAEAVAAATAGKLQARRDAVPAEPSQAIVAADARSRSSAGNAAAPATNAIESAQTLRQEQATADRMERDSARAQARPEAQAMAKPAPAPHMRAAPMASAKSVAEQGTVLDKSVKESADAVASMMRLPPEKWLERIEDLRRQGRIDEARAGFAEFRKRYPDYVVPQALLDWTRQ